MILCLACGQIDSHEPDCPYITSRWGQAIEALEDLEAAWREFVASLFNAIASGFRAVSRLLS